MGYRKTLWREWGVGKCRPSHDYVYVEFCGLLSKYHLPTAAIWHLFPDDQVLLALYWMKRWNEASWSCFRSQGAFSFPPFRANVNSCLHKWHVLCWGSFLLFFFVSVFLSWSLQGSTSASFEMTAQILPIILFWGVTCLLICIWQTILRFLVCSRPDCGKSSFQCAFAFGWFTFLLRVCMPKPIKDIHLWIIG